MTDNLTEADVRAMLERATKATEEPWNWAYSGPAIQSGDQDALVGPNGRPVLKPVGSWGCSPANPTSHGIRGKVEDFAFIAHAREDVPRLAQALLEERVARAHAENACLEMQRILTVLERKHDDLLVKAAKLGETNVSLNKRLGQATKKPADDCHFCGRIGGWTGQVLVKAVIDAVAGVIPTATPSLSGNWPIYKVSRPFMDDLIRAHNDLRAALTDRKEET